MSAPTYLLDTSFLIDFIDEVEAGKPGPAIRALESLPAGRLFLSPVTVAEMLEGAEDVPEMLPQLSQYHFQPLGWATAQRCALNQLRESRRLGENDAWQAALAATSGHRLLGHDRGFAGRPWLDYVDHRRF